MDLPKHYDFKEAEPRLQQYWEKNNTNKFDKTSKKPIYSIDTPPPTVSGKMHLGHAFSYAQQDFVARYKKMRGFSVFYPFGTDDNGLPTKLLVEKTKKVRAHDMERGEFVKLCLKTLEEELRPKYIADWKRIGMSCDFSLFYTTINDHCRKISQKSFIDLYKSGREYRAEAPAMYCPKCRTAISQVECEDKSVSSFFNDIVFKVDGENLVVATTRPELLPACVAVFYHPEDERFHHLKGKMAKVPLFDFEVPILEDERADPEKGTGVVMCCTFGDSTDAEWQKAHNLPIKEAISRNGKMTALAGKYEGKKIEEARKEIIEDMKESNLLLEQKPITHDVNVHERCGTAIEFIHSKQWFIKYLDLKEDMVKWGEELDWYPKHMKNRYDNWVNGLAWDWCISRQLPYGVPFPVWYCEDCDEVIVANEEQLPVDKCPKCGKSNFVPEKDIINTWATSSLTPQIAASLVPELYDKIYPMSLRPQAHDIISFWLFNTVVKSRLHNDVNPWKNCVISGWALDPKGKKMSKSKGNVVEPQVMIDKYGADALRFWAAGSKLGDDLSFQEKDLVTGKKMVTKLWNASKFCLMHLEDFDETSAPELEMMDRWIMDKLHKMIQSCTDSFDSYEYSKTKSETENFFWNTFCDNYLEIVKDRLYNPDIFGKESTNSARFALYNTINSVLKMVSPLMPYITEEIYQLYFAKKEGKVSIHESDWPEWKESLFDPEAEKVGDAAVEIVGVVRRFKSEASLSLKAPIKKVTVTAKEDLIKGLELAIPDIKGATKAEDVEFVVGDELNVDVILN